MNEYAPLLIEEYDIDEYDIAEREEAINNIQQDMLDVHEIFKTLANLSIEQGYLLDNIETHIEHVVINVESADIELASAEQKQKKRNTCLWYVLFILLFLLFIVIVILLVTLK
jgi:syntaxin 7